MTSPEPAPRSPTGKPDAPSSDLADRNRTDEGAGEGPRERLHEAAIQAEFETGRTEDTEAEARRGVVMRTVTIVGGFLIVGIGIAAIPLPGPGWLIVFVGLTLLAREFDWAARWVEIVRRRAKIDELREKSIWVQVAVASVSLVIMGVAIYWSLRSYL